MKLSGTEAEDRFHEAIQICYELAEVSQVPYRCLAAMKRIIPGDIHGWDQFSLANGAHQTWADYHPDMLPVLAQAVDGIHHRIMDHPVALMMRDAGPVPAVSQMSDFLTRRQIRDTGIYQEGYRLLRVSDNLVLHFQDGDADVAMSAHHGGGGRYSQEQEKLAIRLAPHFKQAMRNARIHTAARNGHVGFTIMFDAGAKVLAWPAELVETMCRLGIGACPPLGLDVWLAERLAELRLPGCGDQVSQPFIQRGPNSAMEFYFLPPKMGFCLYCRLVEPLKSNGDRLMLLSKREMEVLSWIAAGKRDGEIAQILGISRRTAEQHAGNILRKLEVETRTTAAQTYLSEKRG